MLRYHAGGFDDDAEFHALGEMLERVDAEHGTEGNRVYYLSTPSKFFPVIVQRMGAAKLNRPPGFARVVIEKPFGHDLASARELAAIVHKPFREQQIYRIDHYLGKETVQNIFAFRFANAIFEPVWNNTLRRSRADHGGRGDRCRASGGVLRGHRRRARHRPEPPAAGAGAGGDGAALDVRGGSRARREDQAVAGGRADEFRERGSRSVHGRLRRRRRGRRVHRGAERAGRLHHLHLRCREAADQNWRWAGTPFYIRAGKRLAKRVTEIAVQFRRPPHLPFTPYAVEHLEANSLVLRIQPDEGISLRFGAKAPASTSRSAP